MADFFDSLEPKHIKLIESAPVFFVATSPKTGRINLSPKGMDTLRVIGPTRLAYLDLTGSGNETAAHLLDDDRITLMICSFTRNALILRVYGDAHGVQPGDTGFDDLLPRFPPLQGVRQIFVIDIHSMQTSCGWGVPEVAGMVERRTLADWTAKKGDAGIAEYRDKTNRLSIDGLPTGLKPR